MSLGDRITLESLEGDHDALLADLRANEPVCWVPALEMFFVTRWDDVETLDNDTTRFTARTDPSFLARALGPNMLTMDPPEATRARSAMIGSFRPGGVSGEYVGDRLVGQAAELIDAVRPAGRADLMSAYASPLASAGLGEVLGLGEHSATQIWDWCVGLCSDIANFDNDPNLTMRGNRARDELGVVIDRRIAEIRADPAAGGAIADFVRASPDAGPLTRDEIVNNVRLMISGGINEPRDGIGLVVWTLLSRPDLAEAVATRPERWPKLVEEVFRRHSPVGTISRQAMVDTTLGGVDIPRGSFVAGILRSANLDENRFAHPTEIDLDRTERGHAAFALGPHRCLGEWLGRQQVRVGAQVAIDRLPGLRLDGEVELRGFEFRGPVELPVAWDRID